MIDIIQNSTINMKPTDENVEQTENLRVNLLTQEIKFAKMLAGNTFDGALKEKHIEKLALWLKNRASCTEGRNETKTKTPFTMFKLEC